MDTLTITIFRGSAGKTAETRSTTLADLAKLAMQKLAATKSDLPWLKLATFGDQRTPLGSLRSNANVLSISGVEGDYDGERVSPASAAELLMRAGIRALIYTSPSHLPDFPRWRVVAPFSHALPPASRAEHLAKINHALGGILAGESFTLSQAYYYGQTPDSLAPESHITNGQCVDLLDLPTRYPDRKRAAAIALPPVRPGQTPDERVAQALATAIGQFANLTEDRHTTCLAVTNLLAPFIASGHLAIDDAESQIAEAMESSGRAQNPGEIISCLEGAIRAAKPYIPTTGEEFDVLPAPDERTPHWRNYLQQTDKNTPKGNLLNAYTALSRSKEWAGVLRRDKFANRIVFASAPPWHTGDFKPYEARDVDTTLLSMWLQNEGIQVAPNTAGWALYAAAESDSFHPVLDYLDSVQWDGVGRIDTWLSDHLGAEDTALHRAFSAKFLLSMVARVRNPGCKVDTVLILEGRQGLRKSSALSIISNGWFTDHMPELTSKDAALQTHGVWLIEFAELDKLHRAEAAKAKAFISTATDRLRVPFGRVSEDFPRQCVFAGTVNPGANGYLQDETGNRRFWPVACGATWDDLRTVDLQSLREAKNQLWAEANSRFAAGESWWIDHRDIESDQANAAENRMAEDVWAPRIAEFVADKDGLTTSEILLRGLNVPTERHNRAASTQVGTAMRRLGWCSRQRFENGQYIRRYFRTATAQIINLRDVATGMMD